MDNPSRTEVHLFGCRHELHLLLGHDNYVESCFHIYLNKSEVMP